MARIVDWLNTKLGMDEPAELPWPSGKHVRPRPRPTSEKPAAPAMTKPEPVYFAADVSGKIIDGGPGKNVLMRNKYVREDPGTHEILKILDDSIRESDEEIGADPYNSCRLDRSRS